MHEPYSDIEREELILRDHLARHRTELANERTLLAYIRTALTLLVAGVTFIRFFDWHWVVMLGWVLVVATGMALIGGVYRYQRVRRSLHHNMGPIEQLISEDEQDV